MSNDDGGGDADRDDDGGARYYWHRAVKWIEGNGGYVHPNLRHDRIRRIVRLGDDDDDDDDGDDDVGGGTRTTSAVVVAASSFDAGTKILDVPDACLLTLHTVLADASSFGGEMVDAVHSVVAGGGGGGSTIIALGGSSSSSSTTGDGKKDHDNHHHRDGECGGLYHDAKDVILALYLAHIIIAGRRRREEEEDGDRPSAPWRFHEPYLATLPPVPPPDRALPRQWTDADLRRRLSGTSLLNTVLREKMGLEREYRCIKEAYYSSKKKKKNKRPSLCADTSSASCRDDDRDNDRKLFPSFEEYDVAMAFVTSRVFEGLGRDGVDAMVPLLDLLDHVRGPSYEGMGNVGGTGYDPRPPPSPGDDGGGPDDDHSVERCRRDGRASDETSVDASRCQDISHGRRDEDDDDRAVAPRGIDAADDLRRQGERRALKSVRLRDTQQRGAGRLVQRRARGRDRRGRGAARRVAKRSRVIFVRPSREGVGVMSRRQQRPQQSSKG